MQGICAVRWLVQKSDVMTLLVNRLVEIITSASKWLAERAAQLDPTAAATSPSPCQRPPPGQGSYTYAQVVDEYFRTIRLVMKGSGEKLPAALAEKLWDSAVLGYATQQELDEVRLGPFVAGS